VRDRIVVLSGGVGGAKLVLGLERGGFGPVTAIVNTGDDFEHLGLRISPDIDTLLYTLSGKANAAQGWGREGESWNFMEVARGLGAPDWFNLGDGDLALHVLRSAALRAGEPLSAIVARFARSWGIAAAVLPMSDDPVATMIDSDAGLLAFQNYFVERRCAPAVRAIRFEGAQAARPAPGVIEAIGDPRNRAIVIAPSNPWLSVAPILAVPGMSEALRDAAAPVVAVSPLVGGAAVKGPTAKIMGELGLPCDVRAVAAHYHGLIDGMLVDERDAPGDPDLAVLRIDTLMTTLEDRVRVAGAALALADRIASG
jgi:LPPG:FO 2-phospho-L-lactate transferase